MIYANLKKKKKKKLYNDLQLHTLNESNNNNDKTMGTARYPSVHNYENNVMSC